MHNTYADFLQHLIEQLFAEDEQRGLRSSHCFLCNTLNMPHVTSVIPSPESWMKYNQIYIERLKRSIRRKIKDFNKKEKQAWEARGNYDREGNIDRYPPLHVSTLTWPLDQQYPNTTALGKRVEWLEDLAKYHKKRGTDRSS